MAASEAVISLRDFMSKFETIQRAGWIKTHRSGNTGIGKTLEDLLGIRENNKQEPDFGLGSEQFELKASRNGSNSMLTLITKTPLPEGSVGDLRERFGYFRERNGRVEKVLHATLTSQAFTPIENTGRNLKIQCSDNNINIISENGVVEAFWSKEYLEYAISRKYSGNLIYVKADSKMIDRKEYFRFKEAYYVSGFSFEKLYSLVDEGIIKVDLRIGQYANGNVHDHGTGFRIKNNDQLLLFGEKKRLL